MQHNGWDVGSRVKVYIDDYGDDKIVFGPQLISIRHFQWRSLNHFLKKVTNAYEACKALPSSHDLYRGAAWWQEFEEFEANGIKGLEKMFYKNILVQEDSGTLIYDPAPIMEL